MRKLVLIEPMLLLACQPAAEQRGHGSTEAPPAQSQSPAPVASALPDLTGKVWVRTDSPDLPGVMRIFLEDGTLVMDSCWETYRLAPWRKTGAQKIVWNEDGMDIEAEIVSLTAQELHLRLKLVDGPKDEHYQASKTPFTCPDMPR